MMKLLRGKGDGEYIQAPEKLSLDELYEIGSQFGKVEIGGVFGAATVEIKANFAGDDYLSIKCRKYSDLKQNFATAIDRARFLKRAYAALSE